MIIKNSGKNNVDSGCDIKTKGKDGMDRKSRSKFGKVRRHMPIIVALVAKNARALARADLVYLGVVEPL